MSNTLEHTELYQKITDICFENGGVTKPMVDKLMNLITLHTQKAKRLSRIDEVRRAQETISYVKLTPEEKRTGNTRTGKYLIDRLEYLNIPTEAGEL